MARLPSGSLAFFVCWGGANRAIVSVPEGVGGVESYGESKCMRLAFFVFGGREPCYCFCAIGRGSDGVLWRGHLCVGSNRVFRGRLRVGDLCQ